MKRFKRFFANLLILIVLYSNTAAILNYQLAHFIPGLSLPLPSQLDESFTPLYGMFTYRETTNHEIEIYGITPSTPSWPQGEMIKLNAADYFPFTRAEMLWRSWLPQYAYVQDAGKREAFAALAAKIRGRYNRANPTAPLEKIVFVLVQWERSLEGYETLKSNEELTVLYAD